MSSQRWLPIAGLAVLLLAGASEAQTDVPKGIVVDRKTQKPVSRARIMYNLDEKDLQRFGVLSDENGAFQLKMISPQQASVCLIHLGVEADGYEPKQETVFPDPSGRTNIRIELDKKTPVVQEMIYIKNRERVEAIERKLRQELGEKFQFQYVGVKGAIQIIDTQFNIARAKMLIHDLDVPPRQIWIQVLLMRADGGGKQGIPDDPAFKAVSEKLKSLFKFKSYEIIGRAEISSQENAPFSIMQDPGDPDKPSFGIRASRMEFDGTYVRLEGLSISVVRPVRTDISTTVNVILGDTVVLGASKGETQEEAVIAVLKAVNFQ
jgi:hypothetical protein